MNTGGEIDTSHCSAAFSRRTGSAGDVAGEIGSAQSCVFDFDNELCFNPGPARISHHHEFLLGRCREFGIALDTFTNDNRAGLMQSPASLGGQPIVARRIHADTPDENIFFAGEHLSILQSWQKGAILSAYHAIDLVVQRVTG